MIEVQVEGRPGKGAERDSPRFHPAAECVDTDEPELISVHHLFERIWNSEARARLFRDLSPTEHGVKGTTDFGENKARPCIEANRRAS